MKTDNLRYLMRKPGASEQPTIDAAVFQTLADAIENEPHLLEVGAENLQRSFDKGDAVVVLDGDAPVACTRLSWLIGKDGDLPPWKELGCSYVHPNYRMRGINHRMYEILLAAHTEMNILATTTNAVSLAIGRRFSFVEVTRRQLPEVVWQSSCCCPLAKTGASDERNLDCKLAHGEPQLDLKPGQISCRFRITPETAARL